MTNITLTSSTASSKVFDNTYDEVPYESYPYSQSQPYHLMTLGTLFGMSPIAPENSRILELGCAAGGNIIPHAMNYASAQCVGVDLSKVQIDEAKKHVKNLGLKNMQFHCCSITDVDDSFGEFDYIICHGVISWVPKDVRDKIFEICNKRLSKNGIAYISYNTLPGWNMIRSIRDMMLYHASNFDNIKDKVNQARLLLNFVSESLEGSKSPYAEMLKTESQLLSKQSDHYLRHDHLEEDNKQYYFREFIEEAQKQDLQYLADCTIASMYVGNMPQKVAEKLQTVGDIVRTEQYMDFINNRRFRSTLLCHKDVKLNRNISVDLIERFNMTFKITPEKPLSDVDLNDSLESLKFYYNNNKDSNLSTSAPCMKAILYTFSENVMLPLSFDALMKDADKKLGGNKLVEVKSEFLNNAMRLVLQGYINITLRSSKQMKKTSKPQVTQLSRYQAGKTNSTWVTNLYHEAVGLNLFEKFAIRYMNGKNTKKQIVDSVMQHVNNGELTLSKADKKLEDSIIIEKELNSLFDSLVSKAEHNGLLLQ